MAKVILLKPGQKSKKRKVSFMDRFKRKMFYPLFIITIILSVIIINKYL